LAVRSDGSWAKGIAISSAVLVEIRQVSFCGGAEGLTRYVGVDGEANVVIEKSRICVEPYSGGSTHYIVDNENEYSGMVSFTCNVVEFAYVPTAAYWESDYLMSWDFSNNIVDGGDVSFRGWVEDVNGSFSIRNNTFSGIQDFQIGIDAGTCLWPPSCPVPEINVENNIIANCNSSTGLWYSDICGEWDTIPVPATWDSNLIWDFSGYLAYESTDSYPCNGLASIDTSYSSTIDSMSMMVDPDFVADPYYGSFALDSNSPAIDAGTGLDPDGTPADLGAFGGPDADCWEEYPWPVP